MKLDTRVLWVSLLHHPPTRICSRSSAILQQYCSLIHTPARRCHSPTWVTRLGPGYPGHSGPGWKSGSHSQPTTLTWQNHTTSFVRSGSIPPRACPICVGWWISSAHPDSPSQTAIPKRDRPEEIMGSTKYYGPHKKKPRPQPNIHITHPRYAVRVQPTHVRRCFGISCSHCCYNSPRVYKYIRCAQWRVAASSCEIESQPTESDKRKTVGKVTYILRISHVTPLFTWLAAVILEC